MEVDRYNECWRFEAVHFPIHHGFEPGEIRFENYYRQYRLYDCKTLKEYKYTLTRDVGPQECSPDYTGNYILISKVSLRFRFRLIDLTIFDLYKLKYSYVLDPVRIRNWVRIHFHQIWWKRVRIRSMRVHIPNSNNIIFI